MRERALSLDASASTKATLSHFRKRSTSAEWLCAYTKAIEERDPERLEVLAAEASALILDHIEKTEAEIVYLREAIRSLEAYVRVATRN